GRSESQKLLQKLDEAGVPYRLHAGGRDVDVPVARWDEVQALVVQNGLLAPDANRGYAGLTDGSFGLTEAQLKLKMRIAQEEQLALTIARFADVENAVVHVTPAARSWNARDSRPAKASVMLQMKPGRLPTAAEVESVVQLVA